MLQRRKAITLTLLAYLGYLLSWGIAQVWAKTQGRPAAFWSLLFFMTIHVAVFGISIPLYLIRRFSFALNASASRRGMAVGLIAFALVFIAGIFFSGSLTSLSKDPPSIAGVVKYVLIFLPMALGICLQCFVLIPQAVNATLGNRSWASITSILIAAASVGMAFWVDQLCTNVEDALTMGILGMFLGIGVEQTRSLPLTYLFFAPIMLINTLAEGQYYNAPWSALLIGFAVCMLASLYFWQLRPSDAK
jgi:hypothetical protein